MGVPQIRERCFIIGLRKDFHLPKLVLDFNEAPIPFGEIKDNSGRPINDGVILEAWNNKIPSDKDVGDTNLRLRGKQSSFATKYLKDDKVCNTLTTSAASYVHYSEPIRMSLSEMVKASSFPIDYNAPEGKIPFLTGMSVAPLMSAQISYQIYKQWLSKINK